MFFIFYIEFFHQNTYIRIIKDISAVLEGKMKLQIVALLDENYISCLESMQKTVCKRYKAYKCTPSLYIPMVTTLNSDVETLNKILYKVLEPYKKFKVNVVNSLHVNLDSKLCSIGISQMGYISRLNRAILEGLEQHNISTENSIINNPAFDFNVPLTSCNYTLKKLSTQGSVPFVKSQPTDSILNFTRISKLEIWKMNGSKFDSVIKSFELRQF